MAAKQEFESRFAKHKDELEWLFMELYHDREALHTLEAEMEQAWKVRSAELKALVRVVIQHFLKTIVVQFVFEVIG